ncbi:MAG: NAD-dependent epimerase/dehydratase family protein [Trueperaceae bacterium]|nr:NAD-dependent epimerase/dehydratase family protein [Trueperaceae bacterium]
MLRTRPRPRHVLVTGGAGFLGSHLVERLRQDDDRVTVLGDEAAPTRAGHGEVLVAAYRDPPCPPTKRNGVTSFTLSWFLGAAVRRPPAFPRPRHALAVGMLVGLAACAGPTPPPDVAPSDLDVRGLGGAVELTWTAPTDVDVVAQVRRDDVATWRDAPLAPAGGTSGASAVSATNSRVVRAV